jgi:tetratricopeptide (TPR) repeat protein
VEGLPLGVELAAAWTRVLPSTEIAREIGRSLDFLEAAAPDMPARQRSLRAVFAYSWQLLAGAEQQALRRLAFFRGSFTREAAAAVADASLPLLAALVDKSLLRRAALDSSSALRYEWHEVLRQYAFEQLQESGELETIAAKHAGYYLSLLQAATADLRGPRQREALAALSVDLDQLRSAWQWAIQSADEQALGRAAESLFHFYDMRSWFQEGAEIFRAAACALEPSTTGDARRVWAKLLARAGWFRFHLGRQVEAKAMLEESAATLRSLDAPADLVFALNYLAAVCFHLGDYHQAVELCSESMCIAAIVGDDNGRAIACNILGQTAYELGDNGAARDWCEQSLAIERRIGNHWSMAYSLTNLGKVARTTGAFREARDLFEQSLRIREQMADIRGVAISNGHLGETALACADYPEAQARYTKSLALFNEIGNRWGMASASIGLGRLAAAQEQFREALARFQAALRQALEIDSVPQMRVALGEAARLLRHAGALSQAGELEQLVVADPPVDSVLRGQATKLIEWSWPPGDA